MEMHQHFAGLTMEHTIIAKWQAQCTHYIEIGGSEEVLVETMSELIECPDSILTTEEVRMLWNFFPPNAFLRRRRKKALLRVNDREGGWKMCILALCRVCVCVYVRARGHVCS